MRYALSRDPAAALRENAAAPRAPSLPGVFAQGRGTLRHPAGMDPRPRAVQEGDCCAARSDDVHAWNRAHAVSARSRFWQGFTARAGERDWVAEA